jgi:two-component system response regulator NreC
MRKIRVLIADDHAILRSGLRMLINAQADMEVVGEAIDGYEAVRSAIELRPDVLVIDLTMPKCGGMRAIEPVLQQGSKTRVLVLTMHDDPAYIRAVLAMGGAGFVHKRAADTELISAIRAVYAGRTYVDQSLAGSVVQTTVGRSRIMRGPHTRIGTGPLSQRECEVLSLLAQGYTNQQAADRLHLSVKTVETYRARLRRKLGLQNRADIVRYAIETGLLQQNQAAPGDT